MKNLLHIHHLGKMMQKSNPEAGFRMSLEIDHKYRKAILGVLALALTACSSQSLNEAWDRETGNTVESFTKETTSLQSIVGPPGHKGFDVFVRPSLPYKDAMVEDIYPLGDNSNPDHPNCRIQHQPFHFWDFASVATPREAYVTLNYEGYIEGEKGKVFFVGDWIYDGSRTYFGSGKALEKLIDQCLEENNRNVWVGAQIQKERSKQK